MKTKNFLITLSVLALATPLALSISRRDVYKEVDAYSVSSLPTTIDLNDTIDDDIRSYYSNLNTLSNEEKQGTNLLKNLKPILKDGQKYLSYTTSATTAVWQAYEITDRDWDKSPATAIEGYNASTNVITGYKYGKGSSDKGSNPYIHTLYVNRDAENKATAWDDHSQKNYGFNQEHIWAKSLGFDDNSAEYAAGARGDLMHLWAGNGRVNGQYHNNYYYGYVDKDRNYTDAGSDYTYLSGNLKGYSKTLGGDVTVFEPQDSDKGDIARAIFYMVARYNYLSGSDSDGINAANPNLELVNELASYPGKNGYTSSTSKTGKMGLIQDLLEWNELDPVDEYEIHRNNILYNNYTNNRNPFIDFPQWANIIWGGDTKVANPTKDFINGSPIKVDKVSLTLTPDGTGTITANVEASENTWEVGDSSIISLDKYTTTSGETVTITGLKEGSTTITLRAVVEGEPCERTIKVTVALATPEQEGFKLTTTMIIIIAVVAVIVIVIIIIVLASSKKARKKAQKVVKKTVKKQVKKSTSKKK